jgi:hypothetical protein
MIRKLLYLFLIGTIPFLTSCDKLKGDIGPAGPQGETGPKGDPGEVGDPAGAFQFSTDTLSTQADGSTGFGLTLTQDIASSIEKGVVLVYAKSGNFWFPLPGIVPFGNEISNYTFAYGVENLELNFLLFQMDATPKKRFFTNLRIVVVPAANARLNATIDYKNYEEVRKAFNLAP